MFGGEGLRLNLGPKIAQASAVKQENEAKPKVSSPNSPKDSKTANPSKPGIRQRAVRSKEVVNRSGSAYSGDSSSSENIFDFMDGDATKAIRRKKDQLQKSRDDSDGQGKASHMQTRRRIKK